MRRARTGERLVTIDHEDRALDERMLVIADASQPIGLAGIMGGEATEVGESTTRVILESAVFHGPTIRNTARRLALRSEASMRHEKGIGWDLPRVALDRAAQLIAEITGAQVASGIVDNDPEPKPLVQVAVDLPRTERLLGITLSAPRVQELLEPLGFAVTDEGGGALHRDRAAPPPRRRARRRCRRGDRPRPRLRPHPEHTARHRPAAVPAGSIGAPASGPAHPGGPGARRDHHPCAHRSRKTCADPATTPQ